MNQPPEIKISRAIQRWIPKLSESELLALHAELDEERRAHDPLVVWKEKGIILDGHHRYEHCRKHGYEYSVREKSFATQTEAKAWMIEHQLARRNMDEDTRTLLLGMVYLARKKERGGNRKSKPQSGALIDTARQIAKETGVSKNTVQRAAEYAEAAQDLGLTEKVMSGENEHSRKDIVDAHKRRKKALGNKVDKKRMFQVGGVIGYPELGLVCDFGAKAFAAFLEDEGTTAEEMHWDGKEHGREEVEAMKAEIDRQRAEKRKRSKPERAKKTREEILETINALPAADRLWIRERIEC